MKRIITLLLALVIALSLCACGGGSNATATDEILQGHSWGETGNESRSIGDASSFYGLSVKNVYYKGNDWDGKLYKIEYTFEPTEENAEKLEKICSEKLNMPSVEKEYYEEDSGQHWFCQWYDGSIEYKFVYSDYIGQDLYNYGLHCYDLYLRIENDVYF